MPTLDWLNRDAAFCTAANVPHRLLQAVSTHGDGDARNLLVQGDNLKALKALLPLYRAQVKCIFIDPPYNTKSAFEHYDDNLEHSQWLSMMLPRLQLLREFLRDDGSIWVTIDDHEGHYLKVLMDEVFGRANFVANALWQKVYSERMDASGFSNDHDHLLCFRRSAAFKVGVITKSQNADQFKFTDATSGLPYRRRSLRKEGSESLRADRPSMWFPIAAPDDSEVWPIKPDGTEGRWRWMRETYEKSREQVEFIKTKDRWEIYVKQLLDSAATRPPSSLWLNEEVGHNHEAKLEAQVFNRIEVFATPKPERLLQRVVQLATQPGDIVLDSFLGSGTTAAVAHKMGRRWIGIEMGDHAATHCLPRLEKVVAGEQGGISAAVGWQGGGGFRFMRLGDAVFDAAGRINSSVGFAALAAFVWQQATRRAYTQTAAPGTPLIGVFEGTAIYLLYNGILGDRRPDSGNVLTLAVLQALKALPVNGALHIGPRVVYGEACRLGPARLAAEELAFRQVPYELGAG